MHNFFLFPERQWLTGSRITLGCGLALLATGIVKTPMVQAQTAPQPTANTESHATAANAMAQITSVSQLSDVQPTDWAFQALQSLVDRYGCIQGYPNRTYRGNRALSRYEFAAGLNACMDRVNDLIAQGTADLVKKSDLATLQRLQEEFAAELATLRGRVDALEARTAKLEAQQFSTTTKLSGEAIFSLAGAGGAVPPLDNPNIVFNNRVRLNLLTSFSGRDLLITGLQVHNFGGVGGSLASTTGNADPIFGSFSNVRLGYEPQFPTVNPANLAPIANGSFNLYKLLYIFPATNSLTLFAGTNAEASDAFPAVTPFASEGQGAISRFAGLNPVVRVSGGTSGMGQAAAVGFIWNISDKVDWRALYGSVNASVPGNLNPTGVIGPTPLGAGFFGGSTVISTQLTLKPSPSLDVGLNYANSYHQINILGTGLSSQDIGAVPGLASGVNLNSLGGTLTWRITPQVSFSTYGSVIFVNTASGPSGSATFTSWMAGLHFSDVFRKGNTAGLIFGQPLARTSIGGAAVRAAGQDSATPYHLEGYFNFRLNDNISITPGVFFVFNPEGFSGRSTTTVGVVRTTFSF